MTCVLYNGVSCACLLIANDNNVWIKHDEFVDHAIELADISFVCACTDCNSRSLIKLKIILAYTCINPYPRLVVSTNVAICYMLFICTCILETIDVVFLELVNAVTENCMHTNRTDTVLLGESWPSVHMCIHLQLHNVDPLIGLSS